jgi:glycerol uptake facilitator-like aquaporin
MSEISAEEPGLPRRLAAEFIGTALLLATVVGSGIMGDTLSGGTAGLALLANSLATAAILVVLILIFGPVSGAHFNPAVTLHFVVSGSLRAGTGLAFVAAQLAGAVAGTILAHVMFGLDPVQISPTERNGAGQWIGEGVATFVLLAAIIGALRHRPATVSYAVGLAILAGYWYTSSTSFANPAVTIARLFTDTFSGIAPASVPAFLAAQVMGALAATGFFAWLHCRR